MGSPERRPSCSCATARRSCAPWRTDWARTLLDAGFLPPHARLFSMAFLGQSAEKSYTVAGAFVAWVLERWGAATVRAWYGGASLESATSEAPGTLDVEFQAWLRAQP